MVRDQVKDAVLQSEIRKERGLTVKYELRAEQNAYAILCIAFDRDGCCGFDYIFDIAERGDGAESLLHSLAEGFVTPTSLREVLEDML